MPQTRSTKTAASSAKEPPSTASSKHELPAATSPPPRLLVLPKQATPEARIVTLPNPRHGQPARYLVCPETGIYEFTRIAAPSSSPRSWLIEPSCQNLDPQIVMDANLFVATPIDPLFLVLPALVCSDASRTQDGKKRLFLSSDDHLDKLPEESSHLAEMLRWPKTRALLEARMTAICDTVEAGDQVMFRFNEDKIAPIILQKARRMSKDGLPASMEEKFVTRTLEAPLSLQKPSVECSQSQPLDAPSGHCQSTATIAEAVTSSTSQQSTAAASVQPLHVDAIPDTLETPDEIAKLQRLRVAFDFICSSYVLPSIVDKMWHLLKESQLVDFSPLDQYLAKIAQLRNEAVVASSLSDYARKRTCDDEEEEARAEKKRRLEEDKKRKAAESRGVKELKKVNISGMKKMSDFFKAK
ncbi:hypothetical protein CDD81_2554 [Ophiocordyceps australis]|uniref:Ribonuclease H2 subunit B n=1 Tax=Ophiocordyceps australis TaxID=1399860 RepID=A0A2C5XRC0_9HYPO|nr:hypothetical protein CDD81_2554 [Ophiocordyceps australis]